MTPRCEAGWVVLQSISCAHSLCLYMSDRAKNGRRKRTTLTPHVEIQSNVDILGRGDEEEIKGRIAYYHMYYPDICETARLDRVKHAKKENGNAEE